MIILPNSAPVIDQTFEYQMGAPLSTNLTVDSLTACDYRTNAPVVLQQTSSLFNTDIMSFDPFVTGRLPLIDSKWKILANLQYLAYGVVEPLLAYPGLQVQWNMAYIDPARYFPSAQFSGSKHFSGEALDFTVPAYADNLYHVLGDVLYVLKGQFVELGLIFSQTSWFHVGIAGPYSYSGGDWENPRIFTRDYTTGESFTGFYPARGLS